MKSFESIQKVAALLMRKPQTYYHWYKINKSNKHLCDIILGTQSNDEHHLIIDKDYSVYCFKFAQKYTTFEKITLQPYQQLKKIVHSIKSEHNNLLKRTDSKNVVLKRIIHLKSELKTNIDIENYRKCQHLYNFIRKYE